MAKNSVNEKQEQFCQAIIHGKTQRQAYYVAYPNSQKWKPENVDARASNLINSTKVLARITELRVETAEENQITRNDLIDQLKSIGFVDIDLENIKPSDKIKALEVMAKILGYDKPAPDESVNKIVDSLADLLGSLSAPSPPPEQPPIEDEQED